MIGAPEIDELREQRRQVAQRKIDALAKELHKMLPNCAELTIAMRKMQEARMWVGEIEA